MALFGCQLYVIAWPEFLKQAGKVNFEVAFMHGGELQKFVGKVGSFPGELGATAKKILMP